VLTERSTRSSAVDGSTTGPPNGVECGSTTWFDASAGFATPKLIAPRVKPADTAVTIILPAALRSAQPDPPSRPRPVNHPMRTRQARPSYTTVASIAARIDFTARIDVRGAKSTMLRRCPPISSAKATLIVENEHGSRYLASENLATFIVEHGDLSGGWGSVGVGNSVAPTRPWTYSSTRRRGGVVVDGESCSGSGHRVPSGRYRSARPGVLEVPRIASVVMMYR